MQVAETADATSLINTQVGPYRVLEILGIGGMGAVYAATHERIGRPVALKVLHSHYARDKDVVQRFFNEARAVNLIEHPGLVQVSDFDQLPNGAAYLVMERLQGQSLAKHLLQHPAGLTRLEVARFGWQIADTLRAVHAQGVVHRDLKPSNVMIVPDSGVNGGLRTKLLDFGIAKLGSAQLLPNQIVTTTHTIMGTLCYMSPEQCRSARLADGKSDVYSLGIMLYEMLAGAPPFVGDSEVAVITMHLHDAPRPLQEVVPQMPLELCQLVERMLHKDKQARPTMQELTTELWQELGRIPEAMVQSANIALAVRAEPAAPPPVLPAPAGLLSRFQHLPTGVRAFGFLLFMVGCGLLGMRLQARLQRPLASAIPPAGLAPALPVTAPSNTPPTAVPAGTKMDATKSAAALGNSAPNQIPQNVSTRPRLSKKGAKFLTNKKTQRAEVAPSSRHDTTPTVE